MSALQVVCPFCSLHCDDIDSVALSGGNTGCRLADSHIRAIVRTPPSAESELVLEECRRWICEAKRIVINGEVIDLETSRAIADFMSATGAELGSFGDLAYAEAFSREGSFTTTLGELAPREASLLVIGNPTSHWPRINEKLASITRRVNWEGMSDLPKQLAALRLKVSQHMSLLKNAPERTNGESDSEVDRAFELIRNSKYLVVLVAPNAFSEVESSSVQAGIAWSSLLGMIRELNQTTRAALLTFDRSLTVRSVIASRGLASTIAFPMNDESVCIHFSPLGNLPNNQKMRTIVIGNGNQALGPQIKCLPASVPGVHHGGIVMRGDGSVTLPLQAPLHDASLLTPGQRLRSLLPAEG